MRVLAFAAALPAGSFNRKLIRIAADLVAGKAFAAWDRGD